MNDRTMTRPYASGSAQRTRPEFKLKALVGSGERIALAMLPVLALGFALNVLYPSLFAVAELTSALRVVIGAVLVTGIATWLWSVILILTRVPRGELITSGPYSVVKHPLYTAIALLVIPAVGLLLGSWLGVVFGVAMYAGSRTFAPAEERVLAETFGAVWDEYCEKVKIPWL